MLTFKGQVAEDLKEMNIQEMTDSGSVFSLLTTPLDSPVPTILEDCFPVYIEE